MEKKKLKERKVSIVDVAKHANVSTSTVSLVLRGKRGSIPLSEDTVKRIIQSARELDYIPNRFAQGLRSNRKGLHSIAVLMPNESIWGEEDRLALAAFCEEINLSGWGANLALVDPNDSDGIVGHPVLREQSVEGCIAIGWEQVSLIDIEQFILLRMPLVTVHVQHSIIDPVLGCVLSDDKEAGKLAAKYLLSLGHKKIIFVGGPETGDAARNRLQGATEVLSSTNVGLDVIWGSYLEVNPEAVREKMQSKDSPTALIACSDIIAASMLNWLPKWGFAVPTDVSVIGFDDSPMARYLRPALTTVKTNSVNEGKKAADLILKLIRREHISDRRIVLDPKLEIRKSTARVCE